MRILGFKCPFNEQDSQKSLNTSQAGAKIAEVDAFIRKIPKNLVNTFAVLENLKTLYYEVDQTLEMGN